MSGRQSNGGSVGKRRGRPPKATNMERPKKFQYHLMKKPKYLCKGETSQGSTPSASRASSPQGSEESRPSTSRRSVVKPKATRKPRGRLSTGKGRGGHNNSASARKGYSYHESEYHYGSDFGDDSDKSDIYDDSMRSASESEDSLGQESESDYSVQSFSAATGACAKEPSPDPIWLQDREFPPLELPESSKDLLVPQSIVLKCTSIYEIIRRFRQLVRLSPFRLEDFCAAICCEEQSPLLTEVHITLLKAILREEDSQQTHFGPLDQKDSVNIVFYLTDCITWPEVLRSYVESDPALDQDVLKILGTTEYPYVSADDRLQVLQFLTDQFLATTTVREVMTQEGPIHYDDHCRICHKLGDLLCCETCPAVFHLDCIEPPLVNVPTGDWQCNLCKTHKVSGVMDCISAQEKQGQLCRQELLGYDRHGRKYWFISRRLFVEDDTSDEIWYYSTVKRYQLLLSKLDSNEYERQLCYELESSNDEIIRQMTLTETLTNQHKGSKKSYIEIDNQLVERLLGERDDGGNAGDAEKENGDVADEGTCGVSEEGTDNAEKGEKEDANGAEKEDDDMNGSSKHVTRSKTGSLTPRTFSIDELKKKSTSTPSKDETATTGVTNDADSRLTRQKVTQLSNGTLYFKLGMENNYKTYVNQFTVNPIALNKPQRNEERDKKRHLSHKFSLTQASEFKWLGGGQYASQQQIISTLRQTMVALEQAIASSFMHQNWPKLRKVWMNAISTCTRAKDFARALCILQACLRGVVFASVWHEQLGHITMTRITSAEREEKKKLEKREKRERDDEEERNRLAYNFVKYSLGLRHQVWKQKGEEYRIHGQWDWVWLSYGRKRRAAVRRETNDMFQVVMPVLVDEQRKVTKFDVRTYDAYRKARDKLEPIEYLTDLDTLNEKLLPRLQAIVPFDIPEKFEQLNVSQAFAKTQTRVLYPKVGRPSPLLDGLLQRRMNLRDTEEQKIKQAKQIEDEIATNVIVRPDANSNKQGECIERQLQNIINSRNSAVVAGKHIPMIGQQRHIRNRQNRELLNTLVSQIQVLRVRYHHISRQAKRYKCYASECNVDNAPDNGVTANVCYSPLCRQKQSLKEALWKLLKKLQTVEIYQSNNPANTKSILEQKLTEAKKESFENLLTSFSMNRYKTLLEDLERSKRFMVDYDEKLIASMSMPVVEKMEIPATDDGTLKEECPEDIAPDMVVKEEIVSTAEDDNQMDTSSNSEKLTTAVEESLKLNDNSNSMSDNSTDEQRVTRRGGRSRSGKSASPLEGGTPVKEMSEAGIKKEELDAGGVAIPKIKKPNRRFALPSRCTKKEETEPEREVAPDGSVRVYTVSNPKGKIYLKKILPPTETKSGAKGDPKQPTVSKPKYPAVNYFRTRKQTSSIMVLPRNELLKLAKHAGRLPVNGFHHMAKNNTSVWPYPCSRPLFKTCWLYRTLNLMSLSAVGLHMRILWTCLRWDDMSSKPVTTDGKHQIATESEIMSLELLKHRFIGTFNERMQYLRRKVVIPLEVPKTVREVQSIRSGLRKRKRAESPQQTEPQVTEEWIDEDKLELWEIKMYGEKQEKLAAAAAQPITRNSTGKLPPHRNADGSSPSSSSNSSSNKSTVISNKATKEEIAEKMEQQLRIQRAAHNQKRALDLKQGKVIAEGASPSSKPNVIQRRIMVKNPDGTSKIIQQTIQTAPAQPSQSNTPKPDGPQKVQIIRGPDGKVSVRGLNPGQQLIQTSDGKLHVLSNNPNSPKQTITKVGQKVVKMAPTQQQQQQQQQPTTSTPQQQIINKTMVTRNQVGTPVKQIIQKQVVQKVQATSTSSQVQQVVTSTPQKIVISNQGTVQKVISSGGQILTTAGGLQKVVTHSNLQQLLQGTAGQKVIVEPASAGQSSLQPQKVLVATTPGQGVPKQILIQNAGTGSASPQLVINSSGQKVVQQIMATPGQQFIIGNQRIILNSGQKLVQSTPIQLQQGQAVQQIQKVQQMHQIVTSQGTPIQQQTVVQQQQQQQQVQPQPQQIQIAIQQPIVSQAQVQTVQAQPVVVSQAQSLTQQLTSGKLQIANVNGQQVLLRPIGNNQAQVVAHIKTQANGTAQIIPVANLTDQSQQQQQQLQQQQLQQQQQQQLQQQQAAAQQLTVQTVQPIVQPIQTATVQSDLNTSGGSQTATTTTTQIQSPVQQSPQQINNAVEQSLLQGQPPGTIIKCVTAQVIQTQQGPRIVLQGLQGSDFTPQQSAVVQQQVKQQLLKAQESNGRQGVLGPTKIYLAIQPAQVAVSTAQPPPLAPVQMKHETSSTAQLQIQQQQPHQADTTATAATPTSNAMGEAATAIDTTVSSAVIAGSITAATTTTTTIATSTTTSAPSVDDGKPRILSHIVINGGNPVAINPLVKKELIQKVSNNLHNKQNQQKQQQQQQQQQQQLAVVGSSSGNDVQSNPVTEQPAQPVLPAAEESSSAAPVADVGDKKDSFVVTPDYIQQTIKNALKQENLNPEIEEKLLNLQRYQEKQMKTDDRSASIALQHNYSNMTGSREHASPNKARKRVVRTEDDDDDWLVDTPKRRATKGSGVGGGSASSGTPVSSGGRSDPSERKLSHSETPVSPVGKKRTVSSQNVDVSSLLSSSPVKVFPQHAAVASGKETSASAKLEVSPRRNNEKRKQQQSAVQQPHPQPLHPHQRNNKVQAQLNRHKEQLKKDMLKKRSHLEKELQVDIQRELTAELAVRTKQPQPASVAPDRFRQEECTTAVSSGGGGGGGPNSTKHSPMTEKSSAAKRRTTVGGSGAPKGGGPGQGGHAGNSKAKHNNNMPAKPKGVGKANPKRSPKKKKIYCTCRTPYDPTKFYVGCDLCNNWFHGDCVGLSEAESKNINEYICTECKHARDTQELYCLCRQPYDETQFYICCDKCQDWFHGRCVGIVQSEAESIDEYICPNCQLNNSVNFANMKTLSTKEFDNLKKLIKQIRGHKSAWPFMEPVDPKEAPDYYVVVKEPMDLQKIEAKIDGKTYNKLSEFISDMTKVFDNCRFYNSKESPFYRCAESLEAFFVQKIKYFRENLVDKKEPPSSSSSL